MGIGGVELEREELGNGGQEGDKIEGNRENSHNARRRNSGERQGARADEP